MKILIIGNARHGKDTVAEIIHRQFGSTFTSSSQAAADIFIYEALKNKYSYTSPEECYADRINHRAEWYNLICGYNSPDKARLAKEIVSRSDMYVGMRDHEEIEACRIQGVFDLVIGVYNPRVPEEPKDSFNINIWEESDFVIPNAGSLQDLERKVISSLRGRL